MSDLKYGPVGDPNSLNKYDRAQARMPDGWHVEGQILAGRMIATTRDGRKVFATGPDELAMTAHKAEAWRAARYNQRPVETRQKYQQMSGRELEYELGKQLATPMEGKAIEVTAFGDVERSWLLPDRTYGASHAVTSNYATVDPNSLITSTNTFDMGNGQSYTLDQTYIYDGGTVKAVGPTKVRERETSAGRETDLQWLRRRVNEILWVMP